MTDMQRLRLTIDSGVGHITLDQPERGNPLDEDFAREFRMAAERCAADPAIRAVLITANGKYFSVGGDLKKLVKDRASIPGTVSRMLVDINAAIAVLAEMDAPTIAAVNGTTAGGAVGLIAGCDIVFSVPTATYVPAFSLVGLCTDSGSSYFLPRRVGMTRAKEFYLLGESWDAERALEYGLVNKIFAENDCLQRAQDVALRLADGATLGLGETKRLLNNSSSRTLRDQLLLEAGAINRLVSTGDCWEGMSALFDKRNASFTGSAI